MDKWLAAAFGLPLLAGSVAVQAQMTGWTTGEIASVARARALDYRLAEEHGGASGRVMTQGMIAQRSLAPNAFVGLGIARIYGRKKRGDMRITDQPDVALRLLHR